ncbi:MAG: hypothetical protein AABZ33_02655 [Chloroflexota bacterium]
MSKSESRAEADAFRLRRMALFPSVFLAGLGLAFMVPALQGRPVIAPIVVGLLATSLVLVVLVRRSVLRMDEGAVSVRFLSIRSTTVFWQTVTAATYQMSFPSISFGIHLRDAGGRRVVIHAGWWEREETIFTKVARRLLELQIPMDEATALIVSRATGAPAPPAQIEHRPLLRSAEHARPSSDLRGASLLVALGVVGLVLGLATASRGESVPLFLVFVIVGVLVAVLSRPRDDVSSRPSRILLQAGLLIGPAAILSALWGSAGSGYVLGFVAGLARALRGRSNAP